MKKQRSVGATAGGPDFDTIIAFLPPASPVNEKSLVIQCQNHWLVNVAEARYGHWLVNEFAIGGSMIFHWFVNDGRGGR